MRPFALAVVATSALSLAACTQTHPLAISVLAPRELSGVEWRVRVLSGPCIDDPRALARREPLLASSFTPGSSRALGRLAPGDVAIAVTASDGCRLELFGCVEATLPTSEVTVQVRDAPRDVDACRPGERCDARRDLCVPDAPDPDGGAADASVDSGLDAGPPADAGSDASCDPVEVDAGPASACTEPAECGPTGVATCNTTCGQRDVVSWPPRPIRLDSNGPVEMSDVALEISRGGYHVLIPWRRPSDGDVAVIQGALAGRGAEALPAAVSASAPFALNQPRQVSVTWDSSSDEAWYAIADATVVAFGYLSGNTAPRFAGMLAIDDTRVGPGPAPTALDPLALTGGGPRALDGFYPTRFVYRVDAEAGLASSNFGGSPGTYRWVEDAGYEGSALVPTDSRYVLFADAAGDIRLWDSDTPGADESAPSADLPVLLRSSARRPALYTRLDGDIERTELVHLVGRQAQLHRLDCGQTSPCVATETPDGSFDVPCDARLLAARALGGGSVVAYLTGSATVELHFIGRAARVRATHRITLPATAPIRELRLRARESAASTDIVVAALEDDEPTVGDRVWVSGLSFIAP